MKTCRPLSTNLIAIFCSVYLLASSFVPAEVAAQEEKTAEVKRESKPTEIWTGLLDLNVTKLRLQLSLTADEKGGYTGKLITPDQTSTELPVDRITRTPEKLAFSVSPLGITFQGSIDAGGKIVEGDITQQGQKFAMKFERTDTAFTLVHQSTWTGEFKVGPQNYDFQFRIFVDNFKNSSVKLDSFTEARWSIPCQFEKKDGKFFFRNRLTGGEFTGTVGPDGETLSGEWIQQQLKFPLTLRKIPLDKTREPKLNRPQTPVAPLPFNEKPFGVVVAEIDPKYEKGVGIAGTLSTPKEGGPFPTVILISGTGQNDRDFTFFEHKPYGVLAAHLTQQGYAVIRYDDRGVGQSVGNTPQATLMNFANDAEAVYRWALKQPEVDPKRVVILGHSEGALLANIVAVRQTDVAGVIMLSSTGVSGKQVFLSQSIKLAKLFGANQDTLDKKTAFLEQVITESKGTTPLTFPRVQAIATEKFGELTEQQKLDLGISNIAQTTFMMLRTPWMNYFLDYDPRTSLAYVKCPLLSLFGENDHQSIPEINAPAIKSAVEVSRNQDFQQEILPGLNHMFQASKTGSPKEYVDIENTIDQSALDTITNWLNRRFKR